MRGATAVLAVLALAAVLAAAAPVAAVGDPVGVRVLEDAPGDVAMTNPSGTPVPVAASQFNPVDIVAADVLEEADHFQVTLWVAGLPQATASFFENGQTFLTFRHDDVGYGIDYFVFGGGAEAHLLSDPSLTGDYDYLATLDLAVDAAAGRLTATVPRPMLGDSDGAPPFPGRALADFRAVSRGAGFSGGINIGDLAVGSVHAEDQAAAPDGFTLPIQFGVRQDGEARLSAGRPYRASNGEAATFIFEVMAENVGGEEAFYRLVAPTVPAGWKVTFPQTQIHLDGGEATFVPVLATVPFAHQHGRLASFLVEMQDLSDPANVGRIELGLHYTEPAQPAGHHDELYLHSREPDAFAGALGTALNVFGDDLVTMNTNEEDPNDDGAAVPARFGDIGGNGQRFTFGWEIPLSPRLQMGIDADLTRQGAIHIPVSTTLPMPAARLEGWIYVQTMESDGEDFFGGFDRIPIARLVPTADQDVGAGGSVAFDTTLVPDTAGDYVAYDPYANLVLELNLSFARPAGFTTPEAPLLQPGGHLSLPLLEYADPVDDLFTGDLGLRLEAMGGAERRAPPGGATLFTMNATGPAGHYALLAHGPESSWVEFPADGLHVADDGLGRLQVLVRVPGDAPEGSVVDLVVEAAGGPADAVRSLARLRVTVDAAAPDESALLVTEGKKDTPAPAPAVLLAGLAAVAVALRRRTT